jgi:hypothetical protein
MLIFKEHLYTFHQCQYVVFGKLFFWFVFMHKEILYPNNLNPAIVAYAISGTISMDVVSQIGLVLGGVAQMVAGFDVNISRTAEAPQEIRDWINETEYSRASCRTSNNRVRTAWMTLTGASDERPCFSI